MPTLAFDRHSLGQQRLKAMTENLITGGITVGSAIAYSLAPQGTRATLLDSNDTDDRVARANASHEEIGTMKTRE